MTAFYEGCFHFSYIIKIHIFTGESTFADYLMCVKYCRYLLTEEGLVLIEHLPYFRCSARCIYYTFVSCEGGKTGRESVGEREEWSILA